MSGTKISNCRPLYAIAIALIFSVPSAHSADKSALNNKTQETATTWLLRQNHTDRGLYDLYVTPNAVRAVSIGGGFEFLCAGPDWTVHCFRPSEKIEWLAPLRDFNAVMMANPMAPSGKMTAVFRPLKKVRVLDLNATRFVPVISSRSTLDAADDIPVSARGADFISRFYLTADIGKVPLTEISERQKKALPHMTSADIRNDLGVDFRSGLVKFLETKSCKKIAYRASDFQAPRGYRRTKDLPQVVFSRAQKNELEAAFGADVGFQSERQPNTKPDSRNTSKENR